MITVSGSTLFLIASVCIIIGFVTGGFIGYSNKDRRKKNDADTTAINPTGPAAPPLADPMKFTELLRLWREKEGAGLFVETSGHLLASSEPLNEKQKNRFIDLIKELADWIKIPPTTISEKIIIPNQVQEETYNSASRVVTQPDEPVSPELKPAIPPVNASTPIKTAPVPPHSTNFIGSETPLQAQTPPPVPVYSLTKPAPKPPVEPVAKTSKSMVEQIDDILQDVIMNSDKPDRKIRLAEEPKEGVIVWVGNEYFIGIDAVPDPIVKDLIRIAVKEWDRQTENRL